jgi:hypothetical protein
VLVVTQQMLAERIRHHLVHIYADSFHRTSNTPSSTC